MCKFSRKEIFDMDEIVPYGERVKQMLKNTL